MVTLPARPHTVTSISQKAGGPSAGSAESTHRRFLMQQDIRADASPAAAPSPGTDVSDDLDAGQDPRITEELLVEEISIDGMCGVY
jgi:mycofactocin precursor